jgi:hypothetical protein
MKIVIEVRGGSVVAVTADYEAAALNVIVADYDNIEAGDSEVSQLAFKDGEIVSSLISSGVSVY